MGEIRAKGIAVSDSASLDGRAVLFVDRNGRVGSSVANILTSRDFNVLEVSTVEDCLLSLETRRPQTVIIGSNFDGQDVLSLARTIKNNPLHKFVSLLLITSDDMTDRAAEWKQSGVTAWIKEPFLPEQLVRMIDMIKF